MPKKLIILMILKDRTYLMEIHIIFNSILIQNNKIKSLQDRFINCLWLKDLTEHLMMSILTIIKNPKLLESIINNNNINPNNRIYRIKPMSKVLTILSNNKIPRKMN